MSAAHVLKPFTGNKASISSFKYFDWWWSRCHCVCLPAQFPRNWFENVFLFWNETFPWIQMVHPPYKYSHDRSQNYCPRSLPASHGTFIKNSPVPWYCQACTQASSTIFLPHWDLMWFQRVLLIFWAVYDTVMGADGGLIKLSWCLLQSNLHLSRVQWTADFERTWCYESLIQV